MNRKILNNIGYLEVIANILLGSKLKTEAPPHRLLVAVTWREARSTGVNQWEPRNKVEVSRHQPLMNN